MVLLFDIILILSLSVVIILVTTKFKIPPLIGFLLTGIVIGPSAFSLVSNISDIEILAEIGIMLLMFTIGLEFSLDKIKLMKKNFLFFGGFQVGISWLVFSFIFSIIGMNLAQSFFAGFILTLSSTAIILKNLKDTSKLDTPYGLKMTGILLFQDAALIPFLILLPTILNFEGTFSFSIISNILISLGGIILLLVLSRVLLPKLFNLILEYRLPELFMVSVFVLIFGIAFAAYGLGASLAMGAFIAGVAISDTDHAHHVNTELIPSRHLFNSIFFISIGMFINLNFFATNIFQIILFTSVLIILKGIIIFSIFYFSKHSLSEGIITSFGLAHIGEFSFILLKLSEDSNLFSEFYYQLFLSSAVLSMFLIPLINNAGERFANISKFKKNISEKDETNITLKNHTIIAGFGINGQSISRTLKLIGIPFNIIEANPVTVKKYKNLGYPIYYGELDRKENLISMGINEAALLVIAISDIDATKRSIKIAKSINNKVKIVVRANYFTQVETMYSLGADLVLSQDLETSLTFLFHILKFYNLPDHITRVQTNILRKEHYRFFTKKEIDNNWKVAAFDELEKDNEMFFISSNSKLINLPVVELEPFNDNVVKLIGIIRNDQIYSENLQNIIIQQFDTIILFGNHKNIQEALSWFEKNN
ncbi:MAG: cation:proton antiporter [Ignavibacteriae bacterium]|nr:cation:proton antiporter [Ignavibacteriota bacterium]MCB9260228.1 cation:proton antiporter [Ignavibacteriales bacterium]